MNGLPARFKPGSWFRARVGARIRQVDSDWVADIDPWSSSDGRYHRGPRGFPGASAPMVPG